MMQRPLRRKPCGFTLVEIMIAIAVVGILAALAYPSYTDYIKRGHRAQARTSLMEAAQWLERQRTATGCYTTGPQGACSAAAPTLPFTQSPPQGAAQYAITLTATASSYQLTATPAASGMMVGDECAAYTLNQDGLRGGAANVALCWGR